MRSCRLSSWAARRSAGICWARANARRSEVRITYGMTGASGGCVYDGEPMPGMTVRAVKARMAVPAGVQRATDADDALLGRGSVLQGGAVTVG